MLIKIIKITISTSFLLLVNQSFNPVKADSCGFNHVRELGANKAKEMARQRLAIKELEKKEDLKSKEIPLEVD